MTSPSRPVQGILWMAVTGLCFIAVTAVVKHGAQDLPAAQAAFLRYLLGLVFLLPLLRSLVAVRMPARDWGLFATRGAAHTLGVTLWFFAMTQIPIAEVTAMNYLNPVYVTLGAALVLGEKLAARRLIAVGVALFGVVVILRPGFREVQLGHAAMLLTAVLFAVSYLTAKPLSDRHPATLVVAMLSVTVTIGLAPLAALVWVPPTLADLGWMFLVAAFATAGHYTMTRAFAAAPIAVTQPVTFLQMVWAVLLGWALFDEPPDLFVVLGAALIIGSVTFIAWRESRLKRQVTPPVLAVKH
ncbi:DMT family transporter [Jannaschia aquimarina]|uniref:RibN_5 protein n=1 Tax=Jannaschia aquimarina TaxID=935700 RepID=A0A0D1D7Z2_9RHOB|nr:DMT family transporter [Jannaschia aquimarina]KIT16073.1 Riboflavin transporter [Jannaschia aquimarina]SNT01688.1 Threonine/homoserine efflux transporter RhtA [Jannaschia aquimarina]